MGGVVIIVCLVTFCCLIILTLLAAVILAIIKRCRKIVTGISIDNTTDDESTYQDTSLSSNHSSSMPSCNAELDKIVTDNQMNFAFESDELYPIELFEDEGKIVEETSSVEISTEPPAYSCNSSISIEPPPYST